MGLRCTVFGHKWGEAGTEREREESGGEVVVTTREVRTCRRCGAEDILGETTEVTALDPHGGETATGDQAEPRRDAAAEADDETGQDPETDDGVILEEDEPDVERDPREWPGRPEREGVEERDGEPEPWPESAREQEAEPPEETFVGANEVGERPDESAGTGADDPAGTGADEAGPRDGVSPDRPGDSDDRDARDGRATGGEPAPGESTSGAEAPEAGADPDVDPGGRDVPEPDDDGIIEAGGEQVPDADPGTDSDPGPDTEQDPDASGEAPAGGAGAEKDPRSETAEPAGDDRVDIPRAESEREEQPGDDGPPPGEGAASESSEGGSSAAGEGAASVSGEGRSGEPEADEGPDEEPEMGADASPRPEDDAEVLEATEPNEQSRVTAEEPVDPSEGLGGERAGSGNLLDDDGGSGSHGGGRSRDLGEAGVAEVDDDAPSLDPTERADDEEPAPEDVEYYCQECGFVDDSRWPSRRAGDVCPDCRRSYLSERET